MDEKKNGSFVKQAGILAAAGIIVRIIGLLYNRPMVQIIGDEGFGYYDGAYAAYNIVLLISSYSIPSAVSKVIAQKLALKEYKTAHRVFLCALFYVLVVGSVASLFVFFGAGLMVKMEGAILPLKVLAPTIFFSGILGVLRGYFQAHGSMVQTSVSQIVEQIINAVFSIGMSYLLVQTVLDKSTSVQCSYGAAGGTVGTGAGVLAGLLFMLIVYLKHRKEFVVRIAEDTHESADSYKDVFKTILLVVTPFILSTCIYNVNNFLDRTIFQDVLIMARGMEESDVAVWLGAAAKGNKMVNIPIALASAMATAMIPGLSADFVRNDLDNVREKVGRGIKVTMLISIPAFIGMMVLAEPVIQVIFPQKATLALSSDLMALLAFSIVFYGLATLTQAILQATGHMMTPIINAVAALLIHSVVMVALLAYMPLEWAPYFYCGSIVLYSLILSVENMVSISKKLGYKQEIVKTFVKPFGAAVIMGAFAKLIYMGVYKLLPMNLLALFLAIGAGVLVYFVLVIFFGAMTKEELKRVPKGGMLVKAAEKMHLFR